MHRRKHEVLPQAVRAAVLRRSPYEEARTLLRSFAYAAVVQVGATPTGERAGRRSCVDPFGRGARFSGRCGPSPYLAAMPYGDDTRPPNGSSGETGTDPRLEKGG